MGLAVVVFTNNISAVWYNQLCIMDSLKPIISVLIIKVSRLSRCPDVSRFVYMIKNICIITECQILPSSGVLIKT